MCSWVPSSTLQGAIHSRKVVAGSYPRRPKGDCDTENHDILSHLFLLHVNHGTLQPPLFLGHLRSCQHLGKLLRRWMLLMRLHCHEAATRLEAAARSTGLSRNGYENPGATPGELVPGATPGTRMQNFNPGATPGSLRECRDSDWYPGPVLDRLQFTRTSEGVSYQNFLG